ncbi:hypothetical protein BFJ63_vAg2512 [Fusarium oxysporum f. sp. narcissi]|uniref:Uncharacterized protein n=1 Tax=Fusarium oxysporum f. sp. narcissi TaxID=451672 RepID=A0A4V1S276_FUSOX|nr:hypothetical protein BFJ63_vAg2512 [Fusarium oxysporum f. sp. narcissi]
MSRPRPGSRRRRKLRREREELGEWVPKQEKEPAQAAADPSEASTIESTTEATTSASVPDSKDTTGETKGRAAIDADTKKLRRQHKELLTKVKSEAEQIRRAYQVDIRDTKKEINRLERKVDEIQEENETLRDEIARERRRMMYERYDGPSHDQ